MPFGAVRARARGGKSGTGNCWLVVVVSCVVVLRLLSPCLLSPVLRKYLLHQTPTGVADARS